jgi:biopolymer transport protein ExbB
MSSLVPHSVTKVVLAVLLLGVFSFTTASLHAQSAPGATPAAPAASGPDANGAGAAGAGPAPAEQTTLSQLFSQGGPVMYALVIASICVVWFTGEGFYTMRIGKLAPKALVARLREAFSTGNYQEAWNICQSNKCFLANVLAAGLERIGRGKDAVEFAIEETAMREATVLRTNTTYLSVIGVVSPMIGLTGTVWGMIKAFRTLGQNGITDPSKLAGNIGEVLVATVSGLLVAIPAFIFFYILRARATTAILFAESQVYRMLDEVPFEQLAGVRIGENFSADQAGKLRSARSGTSQKVSRTVTTNCPSCNAPITVGTTPCPNCGTVLDWGT